MHPDRWFHGVLLANMAQGGSSLLIPLFAAGVLGATVAEVGWITGLASLVAVPAGLLWGRLSDRMGRRKPFVLIGFAGVSIALLLMGVSRSIFQLTLLNVLLSFTWLAGAAVVTLLALAGTEQARWESRIGVLQRKIGTGWVSGLLLGAIWTGAIAPLLGGGEAGLRSLFLVLAGLGALGTLIAWRWIDERPLPRAVEERRFQGLLIAAGQLVERFKFAPQRLYHIASPRRLWAAAQGVNGFGPVLTRYFYAVAVFFTGFAMFFIPYPIFLREVLGLSSTEIFALWVLHSGTSAYFNLRVGLWAERWGSRRVQELALILRASVFLAIGLLLPALAAQPALARSLVGTFFLLTGLTWASVNVTAIAIISKRAPEGLRGQALGTYHALAGLGWVIGSVIGGQIAYLSYRLAFALAAALVLTGWRLARRSLSAHTPQDHVEKRESAPAGQK